MEKKLLNWPEDGFCLGDEAFPLRTNLLKPYSKRKLSLQQKIFNYRLSRARRVVENAFGILASRFRIFLRPIDLKVNTTETLIKAACALHNWLRITSPQYFPSGSVDEEDLDNGSVKPGSWRKELVDPLVSVNREIVGYLSNNPGNNPERLRSQYARAFAQAYLFHGSCDNYICKYHRPK